MLVGRQRVKELKAHYWIIYVDKKIIKNFGRSSLGESDGRLGVNIFKTERHDLEARRGIV